MLPKMAPSRPTAACTPKAVVRILVGKISTLTMSSAFQATTETHENTHANTVVPAELLTNQMQNTASPETKHDPDNEYLRLNLSVDQAEKMLPATQTSLKTPSATQKTQHSGIPGRLASET
jgi:hypothetical protein